MECLQTSMQCTSATEENRNLEKWIQTKSYTEGLAHHCIPFVFMGAKLRGNLIMQGILMSICWHMELLSLCCCLALRIAPGQSSP